ncbi:E3 ubiquitin-protein ligase MYCBP2-like isoform X1 [Branchiostoma floridae]|uniref:RCR-type E3 ubiquitin transferase n=1 Tax=Branchiostoma floridae TaxID=7739 RepID=A0A9J7LHB5_BRAFL|nr:E3 ubiquitin-protein ligase MYCBP2-like isoform X1 [Branchiostoma floridae]
MAAAVVPVASSSRTQPDVLLSGAALSGRFHRLFASPAIQESVPARASPTKKKTRRKAKPKTKEKTKGGTTSSNGNESIPFQVPTIEIPGNASAFNVYAHIRQAVLDRQTRETARILATLTSEKRAAESDSEDETEDQVKEVIPKLPRIVGIGLCGVFELIRETRLSHPPLCARALQALLDMLQGQQPEGLRNEPADVIDSLFQLLIDLVNNSGPETSPTTDCTSLAALACSCLLSLVVARGDTGKLLNAVAALLISPGSQSAQAVKVPSILSSLQRSVVAVLLGKPQQPSWLSCGITKESLVDTWKLESLEKVAREFDESRSSYSAIQSDGHYLYIHCLSGLYKIGSGYSGTIKGHVYAANPAFHTKEKGWLGYAKGQLFFRSRCHAANSLVLVNTETLEEQQVFELEDTRRGCKVFFTDGENIGQIVADREDSFLVRFYNPLVSPMPVTQELPLRLARKCLDLCGWANFDQNQELHTTSLGVDEEVVSVTSGKDIAIIRTTSGKLLYTGKSQQLGIKQGGPPLGKWAELPITKSPRVVQCSMGHEGVHGLLVSEDGSVFFCGTARRGEDGDQVKRARQPKPSKPKKMIKLEGRHVVWSACNVGSSAVVTKEGELYMFGKDTAYADTTTGLISDLKEEAVTQISLGKAHACVLTAKGEVFTFGVNNKGQCGRDFTPQQKEGASAGAMAVGAEDDHDEDVTEEASDPSLCPPGTHVWKMERCMVCTVCGECTGYGASCVSSGMPGRNPGTACGCGSGDSGCSECGICKSCAGEDDPNRQSKMKELAQLKKLLPGCVDVMIGRLQKTADQKKDKVVKKLLKATSNVKAKAADGYASDDRDQERDPGKLAMTAPGQVKLGAREIPATHVVCGLQHTVVLLQNGEVYTFGNNQMGQLGCKDSHNRGLPVRVELPERAVQVAAGSNHTVILTSQGNVYTFGAFAKGQLGREHGSWHPGNTEPGMVTGVGPKFGRRATWVGASGDQTFIKIDESLINARTLADATLFADQKCIGVVVDLEGDGPAVPGRSLFISKTDGTCKRRTPVFYSFSGGNQADLTDSCLCLDPMHGVLWRYQPNTYAVSCYNATAGEVRDFPPQESDRTGTCNLLSPELVLPTVPVAMTTRSHSALHLLGCLDTLTVCQDFGFAVTEQAQDVHSVARIFSKEDYNAVNRFDSHGGGWGYSVHSVEAIRFTADADIILGGFGLFGGRGEYTAKIKLFDLGTEGGEHEGDGDLLCETDDMTYECGSREKYAILFEEPILLTANNWYVGWARVSGPSSDCGASGQTMVTTDDQVVFQFKSSRKSNNGTDVNAGQIPQLLYRLPTLDSNCSNGVKCQMEPVHILSRDFSRSVSPSCFESLLDLLRWSWATFKLGVEELQGLKGVHFTAALLDLDRLVFVSTACMRLLRRYISEVYPNGTLSKKTPAESARLSECVGETRAVLRKILCEENMFHLPQPSPSHTPSRRESSHDSCKRLVNRVLEECHHTFTCCFHAFYPTSSLKWVCLCDLLGLLESGSEQNEGIGRLLSAVMAALCHPTVKLTSLLPILKESESDPQLPSTANSPDENNSNSSPTTPVTRDNVRFPILVQHMEHRSQLEGAGTGHCTFKEVLDKLLAIVVVPVRIQLSGEEVIYSDALVCNTCALLAAIVGELATAATGSENEIQRSTMPVSCTPSRFARVSQGKSWNTGNGSPDAVCFSVDKPGVVVVGAMLYGGGGQHDYELELLDSSESDIGDGSHTQRWTTLELVKGTYYPEDCVNDAAEVKFERPVPIKEGVKYAVRVRNHGGRTANGDGGLPTVKSADGVTFTFSSCSLSSNGTNQTRGQIPNILYYRTPQEGEAHAAQSSRLMAESHSRRTVLSVATAVLKSATDILRRALVTPEMEVMEILGSAHILSSLLPLLLANLGPVASSDPRTSVQVLSLVQDVLPAVASLNQRYAPPPPILNQSAQSIEATLLEGNTNTTSAHYAMVESEHPYKPATVAHYKISFPNSVKWMAVEFDPQCGTAQPEDSLQLYIPGRHFRKGAVWEDSPQASGWWSVLKKFHGIDAWPNGAVVLPGNEIAFSLETASDYMKDEKLCFYGFKCSVVGYEWCSTTEEVLVQLEKELSYLGAMCATMLMRKDLQLPAVSSTEAEEDMDSLEEGAQLVFDAHSTLLGKGFALVCPPTVHQALEGTLLLSTQSNERAFLKDFIVCTPGTSGGRFARWLQPDSYVDAKLTEVVFSKDELKCNWPTMIVIRTLDQYGDPVNVPSLKVEARAAPLGRNGVDRKVRRTVVAEGKWFGGVDAPKLDVTYEATVLKDNMSYVAITMMKAYEDYSFEELRFASPPVRRPSENMLVRANNDGTYSANWTPTMSGWYTLHITVDGQEIGEVHELEVGEPPQGVTPPSLANQARPHQPSKVRKFVTQQSKGLRVRSTPSLQSEQIGAVAPNGTITFIDEVHNTDGVWLRLDYTSLKQWCPTNGNSEAWCLAFNQHLGKNLLVPVEEPKSIIDEIIKERIARKLPELMEKVRGRKGGPGMYQVVKCGASGHNVRCRPSLRATPVGMLVLGNQLTATEETSNSDGTWVRLSKHSTQQYCESDEGEAWSLAHGKNDITYLKHESELSSEREDSLALFSPSPFSSPFGSGPTTPSAKGFDFRGAEVTPPNFWFSQPTDNAAAAASSPSVFGPDPKLEVLDMYGNTAGAGIPLAQADNLPAFPPDPFVFGAAVDLTGTPNFYFSSVPPTKERKPTPSPTRDGLPLKNKQGDNVEERRPNQGMKREGGSSDSEKENTVPSCSKEKGDVIVELKETAPEVIKAEPEKKPSRTRNSGIPIPRKGASPPRSKSGSPSESPKSRPSSPLVKSESSSPRLQRKDRHRADSDSSKSHGDSEKHGTRADSPKSRPELPPKPDLRKTRAEGPKHGIISSLKSDATARSRSESPVGKIHREVTVDLRSRSKSPRGRAGSDHQKSHTDCSSPGRTGSIKGKTDVPRSRIEAVKAKAEAPIISTGPLRKTEGSSAVIDGRHDEVHAVKQETKLSRRAHCTVHEVGKGTECTVHVSRIPSPRSSLIIPNKERVLSLEDSTRQSNGESLTTTTVNTCTPDTHATKTVETAEHNAKPANDVIVLTKESNAVVENGHPPSGADGTDEAVRPSSVTPPPPVSSSPPTTRKATPPPNDSVKEHVKGQFTIGLGGPREEAERVSPKLGRKERTVRHLRNKRDRAMSPVPKEKPSVEIPSAKPKLSLSRKPVKDAISPSVAECMRAVFAAFLWHEGIVHDAMACASFLKFHPNLTKEASSGQTKEQVSSEMEDFRDPRLKNRHSMELTSALKKLAEREAPSNINALVNPEPSPKRVAGKVNDSRGVSPSKVAKSSETKKEPQLPLTLQHLVSFWEEVSAFVLNMATQQVILPSPAELVKNKKERKEREKKKKKEKWPQQQGKQQQQQQQQQQQGRGNLFGEAAGAPFVAGGEKDAACELCGGTFPHPVTYHMKQAHPGCGKHAAGMGYNSGGNYCGGWAGNCGDGGVGGSSWYLMCEKCRDKYLKEKKAAQKEKVKKAKKRVIPLKPPRTMTPMEAHNIMKNNALFLLNFGSAMGPHIPAQSPVSRRQLLRHELPVVSEGDLDHAHFPSVPFLYLQQIAAQQGHNLCPMSFNDNLFREENRFRSDSFGTPQRTISITPDTSPHKEEDLVFAGPMSVDSSPVGEGLSPRVPFQRSISMQGTIPSSEVEILDNSGMGSLKLRSSRRRTVSGNSESGSSLLRHPSSQLARLVESRAKQRDLRDKARQWPVIAFIIQRHDLEGLEVAMRQSLRKAACRVHAMEALNWLLRSVTQPTCLHDLLWFFVASLTPPVIELEMEEEPEEKKRKKEADVPADQKPIPEDVVPRRALENRRLLKIEDRETTVSDHPLSDITVAGEAVYPLPQAFHHLLQTISDIMMVLPNGSALQQIAMRCYCLRFRPADHMFLHRSHVFNNISQILSKSDEGDGDETISTSSASMGDGSSTAVTQVNYTVECLRDITAQIELKASSRTAMIASLTDGSTETFWESGDEDRNKTKSLTLTCCRGSVPRMVYIHIDNTRDLANKVTSVIFSAGAATEDLSKIRVVELEPRHVGWVHCHLPGPYCRVIKVELKGPDNSLRVRQIKVLGEDVGKAIVEANQLAPVVIQQKNCEAETLRVFRLLTKQVFGKLISSEDRLVEPDSKEASEAEEKGESDLREHMVGILFSRSKLTNLQKQVCAHIVQAISMETARVRDEWEANLSSQTEAGTPTQEPKPAEPLILADTYCFELLSMVLALSGSTVGRAYLAQQLGLMKDLLSLLHTGTPRVQRQVASLLRRVLPEAPPQQLANILGITSLPPTDISILTQASYKPENVQKDTQGILDVFLGCITKALSVQVKVKGGGGLVEKAASKGVNSISLATALNSRVKNSSSRWWLRGSVPSDIAQLIIRLVKDMSMGKLSEEWARVTKSAVAESIMTLTKMEEEQRQPQECLYTATLWLALASLCVLDQDHVERLSSGQWVGKDGQPKQKPTCDNHDDGETLAIILCSDCGNLCAECDRYLHLHRKTRQHQRQVFKEEEESIKVDLHEGCGRTKLFWVMALADSKTLKAMVEFRERNGGKMTSSASAGTCRFCGASSNTGLLAIGNVCADPECQEHARNACTRTLPCGHPCGGVKDEDTCLPCLHGCKGADGMTLKQDADDMCMVCFTEALSAAPAIQLICGHVFHQHCCRNVLERKWVGPRISFGFSLCPICKCEIDHPTLKDLLAPIRALYDDVKRKALMRLEYEGLSQCEAITTPGARFYNDTAGYAMNRYAYYVCYKCNKAYYGGEARCDQEAGVGEDYDPAELVCGACSDVSRAQMCPKHGTDFLEYKCRYCCSVAVFFCFGTTHFCNPCHDDFQRVTNIPKQELPHCPAGKDGSNLYFHFCNPCHDDFQRVTNIPKQELPHCPAGKDGSNLYFHFCNPCHDDFQRVTNIPKQELPHCPAGPRGKQLEGDECPLHVTHPPTGEEFALGCGVCRNAHTF